MHVPSPRARLDGVASGLLTTNPITGPTAMAVSAGKALYDKFFSASGTLPSLESIGKVSVRTDISSEITAPTMPTIPAVALQRDADIETVISTASVPWYRNPKILLAGGAAVLLLVWLTSGDKHGSA